MSDSSKRGPKFKITPILVQGIVAFIKLGHFRSAAAKKFGLSESTLRKWLKTGYQHNVLDYQNSIYRQLFLGVMEAESDVEARAVAAILSVGQLEDPKHLEWYLERKYPQRWGRGRGELEQLKREVAELRKMIDQSETEHF